MDFLYKNPFWSCKSAKIALKGCSNNSPFNFSSEYLNREDLPLPKTPLVVPSAKIL